MDKISVAEGSKYFCYLYQATTSFCNTTRLALLVISHIKLKADSSSTIYTKLDELTLIPLIEDSKLNFLFNRRVQCLSALCVCTGGKV